MSQFLDFLNGSGKCVRASLADPITGNQAAVAAFHNTDGQSFGGTTYGLFTGGVNQLINSAGNLDRQRAAFADAMPVTGVALESMALWTGTGFDRARTPNVFKTIAGVGVTAGTPISGWVPAAGKKFRLMAYHLSLSTSGAIIFKDGLVGEVMRTPRSAVGTPQVSPPMGNGFLSGNANNPLLIDVTASGPVDGWLAGIEE